MCGGGCRSVFITGGTGFVGKVGAYLSCPLDVPWCMLRRRLPCCHRSEGGGEQKKSDGGGGGGAEDAGVRKDWHRQCCSSAPTALPASPARRSRLKNCSGAVRRSTRSTCLRASGLPRRSKSAWQRCCSRLCSFDAARSARARSQRSKRFVATWYAANRAPSAFLPAVLLPRR